MTDQSQPVCGLRATRSRDTTCRVSGVTLRGGAEAVCVGTAAQIVCLTLEPDGRRPDTFPSCRLSCGGGQQAICECVWTHQDRVHSHVDPADADHQTPAERQAEAQVERVLWRRRDRSSAWRPAAAGPDVTQEEKPGRTRSCLRSADRCLTAPCVSCCTLLRSLSHPAYLLFQPVIRATMTDCVFNVRLWTPLSAHKCRTQRPRKCSKQSAGGGFMLPHVTQIICFCTLSLLFSSDRSHMTPPQIQNQ